MQISKYHGAGNDFVMIDDRAGLMGPAGAMSPALVAALCDRRTGIGADGVIRAVGAEGDPAVAEAGAFARMDYYNSDGGAAEMCGNGIRCLVVFAHRSGWISAGRHTVVTVPGPREVVLFEDGETVEVDMGRPGLDRAQVPMNGDGDARRAEVEIDGRRIVGTGVSMGNPHFVIFEDDLESPGILSDDAVLGLGPRLEHHAAFPQRANIEFVRVDGPARVTMRVWERGVGETWACGSGACAVAVAGIVLGRLDPEVDVHLPGGVLHIAWRGGDVVRLRGPATEVFRGVVDEQWLQALRAPAGAGGGPAAPQSINGGPTNR